jgi:hypothetical protein
MTALRGGGGEEVVLLDYLLADLAAVLGTDAEYERASARGTWSAVRVLIGDEALPIALGEVRSTSPVLQIEIPRQAIAWAPARGDRLRWSGTVWRVDEPPVLDRLGVAWRLSCYRET